MYAQVVYENGILKPHIMAILNQYLSERFTTMPNIDLREDTNQTAGLGIIADQKISPTSFDVKNAILEAERRKAEALNMLRFKETLR